MPALRIFGGLFAIFLLVSALIRYRRHQISRLNVIISWFIGLGLTLLAGRPSIFNGLFEVFHFEPGNGQRLTAVSMVAIVVLLLLLIRQQYTTDANERGLRLLVEALGRQAFDWAHSETLPTGDRIVVVSPAYNEAENVAGVIHAMPDESTRSSSTTGRRTTRRRSRERRAVWSPPSRSAAAEASRCELATKSR